MAMREPLIASCVAGKVTGDASVLVPGWSIAKTAIAPCALVLVAGRRLDLDRIMPGRRFNLRQLLQHTSGLPCYTESDAYEVAVERHDDPWSEDRLLAHIDAAKLLFEPGQGWSYSNTGYFLVRRLIEQVTGPISSRRSTRWCSGRSEFPIHSSPAAAPICGGRCSAMRTTFIPAGCRTACCSARRPISCASCTAFSPVRCCPRACATRCAIAIQSSPS